MAGLVAKVGEATTAALGAKEAAHDEGKATRDALALVAQDAKAAKVAVQGLIMGDAIPPRIDGQTNAGRIKQLRHLRTDGNAELTVLLEREAVRKRDLLGETTVARTARETKDAAKKAKAKDRDEAKATKKANADAKRDETAETKARKLGRKAAAGPSKRQKMAPTAGNDQMKLGSSASGSQSTVSRASSGQRRLSAPSSGACWAQRQPSVPTCGPAWLPCRLSSSPPWPSWLPGWPPSPSRLPS